MKKFFKSVLATTIGVIVGTFLTFLIVPFIMVLFFKGAQVAKTEPIKSKSILHLRLHGSITEKHRPLDFDFLGGSSIFSEERTMGLYEINKAIDIAKTDKRIEGIYLEIRDFSAGWATITSIRRHIADFATTGKWVYAYGERMDEMGYYLASVATESYLQPSGELEFNGLAVNEAFLKGLFTKIDIEPRIFRVGKFKAAVEPLILDKMSDENREQNRALLEDVWGQVKTTVTASTKIGGEKLDSIASGLTVASADEAVQAGLIKSVSFEDALEDKMKEKTVGKDEELELVGPNRLIKDSTQASASKKGNKIAVIFAQGEIVSGVGSRDSIGSESLRQDILDAKDDEEVGAIVVRVNSPGGDALASDVIWRELRITDDEMPVVVSMGDVAASGAYYIASAARYIYAEPTTITGSIGVFGLMFNTEKFFKNKTGVNFDRVVSHQYADIGNSNRPMSKYESDMIQREVERVYKRFLDVVNEGRGFEKRSDLEQIAEGRVWSGTRAKQNGLVDELGGLDEAIAKAAEFAEMGKDYQVEIFPEEKDPFSSLVERLAGDSVESWLGRANLETLQQLTKEPLKSGIFARLPYDLKIR